MRHHFKVIVILYIITADRCDLPVYHHELGMEGAEWRAMEVHNSEIDVWYILRRRQAHPTRLPCRGGYVLVIIPELLESVPVGLDVLAEAILPASDLHGQRSA